MNDAAELLRPYLADIARIGGAHAASVFLPLSAGPHPGGLLVHSGGLPAVPELADIETATRFSFEGGDTPRHGQRTATGIPGAAVRFSAERGGLLVSIPRLATLLQPGTSLSGTTTPGRRASDREPLLPGSGWIGLRFEKERDLLASDLPLVQLLELARNLSCYLAGVYGILVEPVTGLPGRAVLQALVVDEFERSRLTRRPLALLFVNPREFGRINARFGPATGDLVLRELAARLRATLRSTDPVMRYGAAIFAVPLVMTAPATAMQVGEKIRRTLSDERFLDDGIRLDFNVGISSFEPDRDDDGLDAWSLVQRADVALAAAREAANGCTILYRPELERDDSARPTHLDGLYTGRVDTDYRNMGLLWEALSAVNAEGSPRQLASRVAHKLALTLAANSVAFVEPLPDGSVSLISKMMRVPSGDGAEVVENDVLHPTEAAVLARAVADRRAVRGGPGTDGALVAHAVPLLAGTEAIGALYIAGPLGECRLEPSDVPFLTAFAAQVAVALDRARLAERELKRRDQEQEQLRTELQELRTAVRQSRIVHRSPVMEAVLGMARRVAATDATVLITGESGTGKERLAQLVHDASGRRDRPFVIVDCGSIPATLMESELFGHERGAFTSAQQRNSGRLVLAHGGTVVLDEIGELPLEVQARLLRFVQEKQLTPVGGVRPRPVDVRIVAITNRNLEEDVAAGRFREDLFYRLNVVRLKTPSLRERREDILLLAHHFLQVFSVQYHKNVRLISPAAQALMLAHGWPGNVRELENRILQAVILTQGEVLDVNVLGLSSAEPSGERQRVTPSVVKPQPLAAVRPAPPAPVVDDPWARLRHALGEQIQASLESGSATQLPLGRWLAHEAALVAYELAGHVSTRAAAMTASPETTFARRLEKAEGDAKVSVRSPSWGAIREALQAVLRDPWAASRGCIFTRLEDLLLKEVLARTGRAERAAAQLLDVSLPTLRRWRANRAPLFSSADVATH